MQVHESNANNTIHNETDAAESSEARNWEGNHLPILLLGILGVGGLALVMGAIFIFAPLLARI